MDKNSKIFIVGHDCIVENALTNYFRENDYKNVVGVASIGLNPAIQPSVDAFFQEQRPEYVFLASTRSGGIEANRNNPGEFIYHNLASQSNILYASYKFGVKKVLFYAGSCVYPRVCPQPMKEEYLLTGELESTSEPYSVAKIAGIKLCQAFKRQYGLNAVVMVPATIYGPGSNMNIETAHVMGALIGKFARAQQEGSGEVSVWGSGRPRREFLYVDDFIDASLFLMNHYDRDEMINAGCGEDVSIKELAALIGSVSGYKGNIIFDASKPDGTQQKLLDHQRISRLGWQPKVNLKQGIEITYQWYIKQGKERV